jgi:hypothetical protein
MRNGGLTTSVPRAVDVVVVEVELSLPHAAMNSSMLAKMMRTEDIFMPAY